ncbi:hypothetical protein [Streptomyces sp. NPDC048737]|uniref:hypothetical protein n=1 Tax=unclassified Streptomyces TaxID=2593676 RepID=UPI003442F1A4
MFRPVSHVVPLVRARRPGPLLVAEAYRGLEQALQRQGFDHCYDKGLHDRPLHEDAGAVRAHPRAGLAPQRGLARFLENHGEPRAATTLPGERGRAAALTVATPPGATLWHDGQFEGRCVRPPVFLSRRHPEPVDEALRDFYGRLLRATPALRRGERRTVTPAGLPGDDSRRALLSWTGTRTEARHLVVVNHSGRPARARLPPGAACGTAHRT